MTIKAGLIRVLVVDDHPAVRAGVRALLDDERDMHPVATAADWAEALEAAELERPDVAVVDFHLGRGDGLTLCRSLSELEHPPRTLLFSAYVDPPLVLAALVAGVDGVLSKGVLGRELCHAVRALGDGRPLPLPVTRDALAAAADRLDPADLPILGMLVHGTPPVEIAATLGTNEHWLAVRRWAMLDHLLDDAGERPAGRRAA